MISPKHKFSGKFTKETHVVGGVCISPKHKFSGKFKMKKFIEVSISPKHKFSGKFTKETGGVF
jgi:hypothetical protein